MNVRPCRFFLVTLISLALASPSFAASVISLSPVADSFLSGTTPSGNFGGAGAIAVSAAGLSKGEFQSLMTFDFSAAKAELDTTYGVGGWAVESLSLQLTAASPNNAIFNASAAGIIGVRWVDDDTWVEGAGTPAGSAVAGVNFNSLTSILASGAGPQSAGLLAFSGGTSGNNTITLTGSSGLLADVLGGSTASFHLYAMDATASGVFLSRSFGTVANRPVMTLTAGAIPEPSSGWLAILALAVPVLRRRR